MLYCSQETGISSMFKTVVYFFLNRNFIRSIEIQLPSRFQLSNPTLISYMNECCSIFCAPPYYLMRQGLRRNLNISLLSGLCVDVQRKSENFTIRLSSSQNETTQKSSKYLSGYQLILIDQFQIKFYSHPPMYKSFCQPKPPHY